MMATSNRQAADVLASECDCCSIAPNRRTFIRQTTLAVGGVLAAIGISGETAQALSLANATLFQSAGNKVSYPIPDKDGVQIDKNNGVILVRWLGSVYALALACPHQNTALTWLDKDERFQCPKHRSQYSADGYFISGRATRGMDRYAITRLDKTILVDLTVLKKESDDEKVWAATCVTL
jgi:Rieske Fe-S protein